jgi:sRNA-binding regulator protein Hfq
MSSDSTIYTIGTALNRARDNDIPVRVLVEGEWLSGRVVAVDGFGVVLHC